MFCYNCCYFEIARFCKNHVHGLFLLRTLPIVQLYFLKSNSPSEWIVRIPVHQVLRQSFSLVWSSLSVTCLSSAQNSVRNASPGNVIKGSWCERTGWLKVAQTENYAWRNTFTPLRGPQPISDAGLLGHSPQRSQIPHFVLLWPIDFDTYKGSILVSSKIYLLKSSLVLLFRPFNCSE